jgi:hypothetical protein
MSGTLFEVVTVHCFFARWCSHTVQHIDPYAASREMEAHYEADHYGRHLDLVYRDVERAS